MNLISAFSIPQISRVARRTALTAVAIGGVALIVLAVIGYGFAGIGVCIGLALALGNFRMTAASAVKAANAQRASNRRPLALNTLARLGVVTVIAVGLLLLKEQLGFGVLLGLAIFQFVLLANTTVSLLKGAAFSSGGNSGDQDLGAA
jgi:hypothetical protein